MPMSEFGVQNVRNFTEPLIRNVTVSTKDWLTPKH
jgi:hypothetical protein